MYTHLLPVISNAHLLTTSIKTAIIDDFAVSFGCIIQQKNRPAVCESNFWDNDFLEMNLFVADLQFYFRTPAQFAMQMPCVLPCLPVCLSTLLPYLNDVS